jgi:hypothetical protein
MRGPGPGWSACRHRRREAGHGGSRHHRVFVRRRDRRDEICGGAARCKGSAARGAADATGNPESRADGTPFAVLLVDRSVNIDSAPGERFLDGMTVLVIRSGSQST